MKDYYKRLAELVRQFENFEDKENTYKINIEIANLNDEKRIFDLTFKAACSSMQGLRASSIETDSYRIRDIVNLSLNDANELLKQMKVL